MENKHRTSSKLSRKEQDMEMLRVYAEDEVEWTCILCAWNDLDRFHRLRTVQAEDFRVEQVRRAYRAMCAVVRESQTIDMMRVILFLRSSGAEADYATSEELLRLEEQARHVYVTDDEFGALIRQVKKIALQRRLLSTFNVLLQSTQRPDLTVGEIRNLVATSIENSFLGYTDERSAYTTREGMDMLAEELLLREQEPGSTGGRIIPLGWRDLAPLVPGAIRGQTIVVLARSSMGKSAFTLQLCRNLARRAKTLLVSLEVGVVDICRRLSSQELQIPAKSLRAKDVLGLREAEQAEWNRQSPNPGATLVEIPGMNLLLDKPKYSTVEAFIRHVKLVKMAHPDLAVVAIDYAQQLARKEPTPQAEASARLKTFALQEGLVIIEALQAPTELDQRKDTRPYASDIRFSKSWEQDADIILALWRPGFYDKSDQQDQGESWCFVRKNRDGETGEVPLLWVGATTSFLDLKQPLTPEQIERINKAARQGSLYEDEPESLYDVPPMY